MVDGRQAMVDRCQARVTFRVTCRFNLSQALWTATTNRGAFLHRMEEPLELGHEGKILREASPDHYIILLL